MTFTSTAYLFFLPLVFFLYWLIQRNAKAQNFLLLAASYVFYGWWDSRLLSIIALMTLATFYAAILIESSGNNNKMRRTVCGLGIVVCVATLVVFKFFNFFMTSASEFLNLFHIKFSPITLNIILPAGISFYTFQSISYLIDVYRRKLPATRNIITFATYIAFFPQLVAGPIERATRMIPILQGKRTFCYAQAVEGLRRIIIGLFKKMIIADNCAETVSGIFNSWNSQRTADCCVAARRRQAYTHYSDELVQGLYLYSSRRQRAQNTQHRNRFFTVRIVARSQLDFRYMGFV